MGERGFQAEIMGSLRKELGADEAVSKWLQEILDVDYSTARRKYTGDIKLSLEQFSKIINLAPNVLSVTLKEVLNPNTVVSTYCSFRDKRELSQYLKLIIQRFEEALINKASLKYVARDLPLFFFLADRNLAEFKISMWANQLGDKGLLKLDIDTYSLCREVHRLYRHLGSIEVWSRQVLNNQLDMIDWYCNLKRFGEKYRGGLYESLMTHMVDYKQWSKAGKKDKLGKLDLLFTDFMTMNNGGLIESKGKRVLMTALSSANFMTISDSRLCQDFQEEFRQHQAYAVSVSNQNALERENTFATLLKQLEARWT